MFLEMFSREMFTNSLMLLKVTIIPLKGEDYK